MTIVRGFVRSGLTAGLFDQAVVSLGNFGLNVLLARTLAVQEYGVFSLILSLILFFNTLHQALVTYPLSVRGALAERASFEHQVSFAALITPALAALCAPLFAVATVSVGRPDLLPGACLALAAWQLQEVYRRSALARAEFRAAIVSDAVRYLGVVAAILLFRSAISIERALLLLIALSLVAAAPVFGALRRGFALSRGELRAEIRGHWRMGSPLLGANLLAALSTQWFLWLLAWWQGPSGSAALMALATVAAVASPIMFGAENILVPEIARLRPSLSFEALARLLLRRGLACAALVGPLLLFVAAAPQTALHLFYGRTTAYITYDEPLRLLAAAYASFLSATILSAALRGYGAGESVFKMQLYPALFGITLGSLLTLRYGVTGACAASLLVGILRTGIGLQQLLRLRDAAPAGAAMPSP